MEALKGAEQTRETVNQEEPPLQTEYRGKKKFTLVKLCFHSQTPIPTPDA